MDLLALHVHALAQQIADGADHPLEAADVRVRWSDALRHEIIPQLFEVALHIAVPRDRSGGRLRERAFEAEVRVLLREALELLEIEAIFGMTDAEEERHRRLVVGGEGVEDHAAERSHSGPGADEERGVRRAARASEEALRANRTNGRVFSERVEIGRARAALDLRDGDGEPGSSVRRRRNRVGAPAFAVGQLHHEAHPLARLELERKPVDALEA